MGRAWGCCSSPSKAQDSPTAQRCRAPPRASPRRQPLPPALFIYQILRIAYAVSGAVAATSSHPCNSSAVGAVIIPTLQTRKPRHGEARCLLAGDRAGAPVSLLLAALVGVPPGLRPSHGFFCLDHCCCHPRQKPFLVTAEPPAPGEVLTHSRRPAPLCWGEEASVGPTAASKESVPPPARPSLDAPEHPGTRFRHDCCVCDSACPTRSPPQDRPTGPAVRPCLP